MTPMAEWFRALDFYTVNPGSNPTLVTSCGVALGGPSPGATPQWPGHPGLPPACWELFLTMLCLFQLFVECICSAPLALGL